MDLREKRLLHHSLGTKFLVSLPANGKVILLTGYLGFHLPSPTLADPG